VTIAGRCVGVEVHRTDLYEASVRAVGGTVSTDGADFARFGDPDWTESVCLATCLQLMRMEWT
jgi:hypothetical protein